MTAHTNNPAPEQRHAAPAPDVWSGVIPPGGYVCGVCGQPTESEPCPEHQVDAPADTDLREQIDAIVGNEPAATLTDALLRLVRAQVEAARRDTLNQAAAGMPTGSGTTASYWDGVRVEYVIYERSPNDLTPQTWLRDQAARGETRQP